MSSPPQALPRPPERQRKRKYSFDPLPGEASGSSANQDTIARNFRQRELPPLEAALVRITNNRRTRIHNQTKSLTRKPGWEELTDEAKGAAIEDIRVRSEARYQEDKIKVLKQYEEEVEGEASQTPPEPPATLAATAPATIAATTTAIAPAATTPTKTCRVARAKPRLATTAASSRASTSVPATITAPTETPQSDSEFEGITRDDSGEETATEEEEDYEGGAEAEEEGEPETDSGSDLAEHVKSLREASSVVRAAIRLQLRAIKGAAKKS